MVLWRPTKLSRMNTKIICPFHYRDWNAKVGSQEKPGVTGKFGLGVQNEGGQRLIEFCQDNALFIANTLFQQHKRRLYTWTSPDGQHQNQIDHILCSQRWRSSIQAAKTGPGADCGSEYFQTLPNVLDWSGTGCLLWWVHSLGKTLWAFALLHSVLQGQICLLLQVFLDFLLLHTSPL